MTDIQSISIQKTASVLDALKQMDRVHHKSLLVFDGPDFYSMVTIGEIQRAIIRQIDLAAPVDLVIDKAQKQFASETDSEEHIKAAILQMQAEWMPVIDAAGRMTGLYTWADFFPQREIGAGKPQIDLPVVIMAGGAGTRLKPLTNVIPKPLVPVGDKSILEVIMDQFEGIGCSRFYLSVNYKADMIRYYLSQLPHAYRVEYIAEDKPLGTIGSVSLLKNRIFTPFFVSNCDIVIDQDYRDVYAYHRDNHNDLTIVAAVKSFTIPYGVVETGPDGIMTGLREKPETTCLINTGVYLLEPGLIDEIPQGEYFHVTHLMEQIRRRGGRVGCFPVSEYAWHDIGDWPEFLKLLNK